MTFLCCPDLCDTVTNLSQLLNLLKPETSVVGKQLPETAKEPDGHL